MACDPGVDSEDDALGPAAQGEAPGFEDEDLLEFERPPEDDSDEQGNMLAGRPAAPEPACEEHSTCFSACGTRFRDGSCELANEVELEGEDFGTMLCDPVVLEISRGNVRFADRLGSDDARCFLQTLRYGHDGVAELYWNDEDNNRSGKLVVRGLGRQMARIEMQVFGAEPECGRVVALSARRAHIIDERDPLFQRCLNELDAVDPAQCLLGRPAADFYRDHDFVYDVAFPWLSGACGVQ